MPYGDFTLSPALSALHYGLQVPHTHIHTYIHIHTYTHTHTCIHTHTHIYVYTVHCTILHSVAHYIFS